MTQALCEVCAVSFDDVRAVAEEIPSHPQVIALDPMTLGEVLSDVRRLAEVTEDEGAADELLDDAADRIDAVRGPPRRRAARGRSRRSSGWRRRTSAATGSRS